MSQIYKPPPTIELSNESSFFVEKNVANVPSAELREQQPAPNLQKNIETTTRSSRKKCLKCNKRLSLTNEYLCKCQNIYCGAHKYPDTHNCTFDHKTLWRESLEQKNIRVVSNKIDRV